jgi:outer membrane protein insertion porin family
VSQQNVFGSGNALSFAINTSKYNRQYSFLLTEPYWTVDGVSRTLEFYQRRTDPTGLAISQYASDTIGAAIGFGLPITESDTVNVGVRTERSDLTLFDDTPQEIRDFVNEFGNPTWSVIVNGGWARDTRDDILYPTRGRLQSVYAEVGIPPGDLEYYKAQYVHQLFWPVYGDFVLMLRGEFGYADGLRGKSLPFYKAFYGGGVGSVRGYESNSLGPQDEFGNVLGGRTKIVGNIEVFYPILKGDKSVRASVFADAGQISGYPGQRPPLTPYPDTDFETFRYSAGVGLAWNSPVGPLKFSYALPLNEKPGDRVQKFQFQVGNVF